MTSITGLIYDQVNIVYQDVRAAFSSKEERFIENNSFVSSALGPLLIGLMCILPLIIILRKGVNNNPAESKILKVLMCFAIGERMGNIIFHILPTFWEDEESAPSTENPTMCIGTLALFITTAVTILGKIGQYVGYELRARKTVYKTSEDRSPEGSDIHILEEIEKEQRELEEKHREELKKASGYLLLLANGMYNFTQGLAVVASFLISFEYGIFATFAFLLHEIPHQVGGYVMLLRCSFIQKDAVIAQLLTVIVGLMGALVAIDILGVTSAMDAATYFIAPVMAGGYVFIALVTLLPDLEAAEKKEALKKLLAVIFGFGLMAVME